MKPRRCEDFGTRATFTLGGVYISEVCIKLTQQRSLSMAMARTEEILVSDVRLVIFDLRRGEALVDILLTWMRFGGICLDSQCFCLARVLNMCV